MLELKILRDERPRVIEGLRKRGYNDKDLRIIDDAVKVDDRRKSVQTELDQRLADSKQIAKSIGKLYAVGKTSEAEELKIEVANSKIRIRDLEEELRTIKNQLFEILLEIPNIPHILVPSGAGEADNETVKPWSKDFPALHEKAQTHWELAEKFQLFDLPLGVKIAGSGFPVFKGRGAILQRALINFFLDSARDAGYIEIAPPILVNEDTARATGQLPDKEGQMYHVTKDNFYLIPTAEVPLTNIYRDVILEENKLPIKITAYTPCFRREAGSYGAHVKGLNRVHQFDKVEIVQIAHPSTSYEVLDEMCGHVSSLLDKLELPYRILRLCGGDMGFTSSMTYDFEVYSAAQERWLEVSSVSNFETYQSNRLSLRLKG